MVSLDQWFASGSRIPVWFPAGSGGTRGYEVFCLRQGSGPWITFLHGFPTCSWDWAPVAERLQSRHRLLLFDFLGFGDSDKPARHAYSLFDQASITEQLWRRFDVPGAVLVAHDYGVTVAQELLARLAEGRLAVRLEGLVLMNGGLYPEVHRPLRIQKLLADRLLGPLMNRFVNESTFRRNFASIFTRQHPVGEEELRQHWQAIVRRDGLRNYHRLMQYWHERRRYRDRWVGALEQTRVPLRFLWGMEDPISGAHMAAVIRQRLPRAEFVPLEGVGHYPQLEVPDVVAAGIAAPFKGT
ncbi:MAG TPA: alpha/beta hydrolase [Terriglobales bacterium]|nr:alpha/beta hydrolase [Terriglobales bacterium]